MTNNWITPDWPVPPAIKAASTLAIGGVSTGAYSSWNLGAHVGDDQASVEQNRLLLRQRLRLPSEPVWLKQVHGCDFVEADTIMPGTVADASFTRTIGTVCSVMTADCLPLLLCTEDGIWIAAVHCGWRSLLAGIIAHVTVNKGKGNLLAWMGPAIGPHAFEVGPEVRQLFIDKNPEYNQDFIEQNNGKWLADIYGLTRTDLQAVGVTQIYGGDRCTFSESDQFFSYRRQGDTGRMATLIWRETEA